MTAAVCFQLKKSSNTLLRPSFIKTLNRYHAVAASERIVRSPAPFLQLPKGNFVDVLFQNVQKWETKTVLECSETGKSVTYAELIEQSARWSGFLKHMGVSKGDVISILTPNCIQYGPIFIGTSAIGAALSPINWKSTPDEIRRMLKINRTQYLIYSPETEENVMKALKGHMGSITLFSIGKPRMGAAMNVNKVLDSIFRVEPLMPEKLNGNEVIYMPFSSGTTGPPKAVALSHNAFIANVLQFSNPYHAVFQETSDQVVAMAMLPFFHIYAIMNIFCLSVFNGRKIVIVPKFDPKSFIKTIINHKVSHLHTVPTLLNVLNKSWECNADTMGHIRSVHCGAAPVHESSVTTLKNKIKRDIMFSEGYGMTEALITNVTPRRFPRIGTCGQLLSNVEAKVIHPDTEELLGPNENGEVCIRTPSMMQGYVNNLERTQAILRDGWIHTGDIGHYDNDGFFTIVDRTKDLIKVQGIQVSPSEIEDELQKHPYVKECSVIGVADPKTGEAPRAYVVPDGKVTEIELHRFLEYKLSKHKQLRGGIYFLDSLPKSPTGKILRRILKET